MSLANLVWGRACAGCGMAGRLVCPECHDALAGPPCRVERGISGFPLTQSCALYDELSSRFIVEYKDRGRWGLAGPLGALLARACVPLLIDGGAGAVALVPVPSRPQAVRARGADVLARLAASTAASLGHVGVQARALPGLRQSSAAVDHVGLNRQDRWRTTYGSMRWVARTPAVPVIVVDDVVTSGASLSEAVRACAAAGVVVLGAATLAARGWQ